MADLKPIVLDYETVEKKSIPLYLKRGFALLASIGTILTYSFVVVATKHAIGAKTDGMAPVGILLLSGSFDAWGCMLLASYSGIVFLLVAPFINGKWYRYGMLIGIVLLLGGWILVLCSSMNREITLLTSLPFLPVTVATIAISFLPR